MKIENITLYKTPLDNEYKNVIDYKDLYLFRNEWESFIFSLESLSTKSVSLNKRITINVKYEYNDLREYNYCRIYGSSGGYYYFITSIDFNDTLGSYTLNLQYDEFMNNKFSVDNRKMFFQKGHLDTTNFVDLNNTEYIKNRYICEDELDKNVLSQVYSESDYIIIWARVIFNDFKNYKNSVVPSVMPANVGVFPFAVYKNSTLSIDEDITDVHFRLPFSETPNEITYKLPYFQQEMTISDFGEFGTSINSIELTATFPSYDKFYVENNELIIVLADESLPANKRYFEAIHFDNFTFMITKVNFETSINDIDRLSFSLNIYNKKYNLSELTNFGETDILINLPVSENFFNDYYFQCGNLKEKINIEPSSITYFYDLYKNNVLSLKFKKGFNSYFNNSFKINYTDKLLKSCPINSIQPFSVSQENEWYRNNKYSFFTSLAITQLNALSNTSILQSAQSFNDVAKYNDFKNQKDRITLQPSLGGDNINLLDIPFIINYTYKIDGDTISKVNDIINSGANFNVFIDNYVKQMSSFNYIKSNYIYLNDIKDLESRKVIENSFLNGVRIWSYIDAFKDKILKFDTTVPNIFNSLRSDI